MHGVVFSFVKTIIGQELLLFCDVTVIFFSPEHISLVKCVSPTREHISLDLCVSRVAKHIFLRICGRFCPARNRAGFLVLLVIRGD